MKKLIFALILMFPIFVYSAGQTLTIERLFESPELDGPKLMGLKFSPTGQHLTYLSPKKDNYEVLDLWEFDLKTGQPRRLVDSDQLKLGELSEIEKARLERMRITRKGITEYFWSEKGDKIVFPAGGELYLYRFNKALEPLTQNEGAEVDINFSPSDNYISYTRDHNLYVMDLSNKKELSVTTSGKEGLSYGSAEFIAQEEMHRRDGHWWSKDEQYLALTEVDESPVQLLSRYEINADGVSITKQRYPDAGSANVKIRLGYVAVTDLKNGKNQIQWISLGNNKDIYLARVHWTHDGQLIYQVQSRDQKKLEIFSFDPRTQKNQKILQETHKHWINLHDDWHWLKESQNWIWASEKTGYKHLYLMDRRGRVLKTLTQGSWNVSELNGVDEKNGWIYFTASIDSPLDQHLYRVSMTEPQKPKMITPQTDSWNSVIMDKRAERFVRYYSSPQTPTQVSLHHSGGEIISKLLNNEIDSKHPLYPYKESLVVPEFGFFKGPSKENIYYSVYKPKNFDPQKKYPLIVYGYGGPGVRLVGRFWLSRISLFAQVLTQKGFVVAVFDNRGSKGRGRKFEDALYRSFGTVEVEDQKAGVEHLVKLGFIDQKRVGFYGWSYGGYLSLMLLAKAPETYKANVSVAPVTDFALYDTHYTERFMGLPKENKKAYKRANVLEFVPKIKGHLLVMHGMADDNVLFTNSTILFKKLQEQGIVYESVTYPGSKHGISGKLNQTHVHKTIVDFFERRLMN